ncbi:Crp/Fnr family transcriptional regulator [Thiolapillus brandeum]|uniref:HTH crp-type domain-containing protein n=1 Tax=Thiolapillus brandeum TaxID=1076588 RepID=A0A7U6JHD0_9GAMM|nr:Crp/Fnr family transcriptional regulator [Thiolapillus brandeum]BAO44181.1 conserved hypothetical protein [Thiolapillus brandeum]
MSSVVENSILGMGCRCCPAWKFCFLFHANGQAAGMERHGRPREDFFAEKESIYVHGQPFHEIHVVCEGIVKTETESMEGKLQVTGFYMPGELFGLEGVGSTHYPGSAMACVASRVCSFSFKEVSRICNASREFLQELLAGMGRKIRFDGCKWKLVESETAYYRVLFFLCDLLIRQQSGAASAGIVALRMEKRDISNFLGMNPSTLSRELWKLEMEGLIRKQSKEQIHVGETALSLYRDFT